MFVLGGSPISHPFSKKKEKGKGRDCLMSANTATMATYLLFLLVFILSWVAGPHQEGDRRVWAYSRVRKKFRLLNVFLFLAVSWHCSPLKVVGNEKKGGSRRWRVLGKNLGPWRLMFIFILNMPSAIKKSIVLPFPLITAKLRGDYFDNRQYGENMNF